MSVINIAVEQKGRGGGQVVQLFCSLNFLNPYNVSHTKSKCYSVFVLLNRSITVNLQGSCLEVKRKIGQEAKTLSARENSVESTTVLQRAKTSGRPR